MKAFITLNVAFAKDQVRAELINVSKIYRIIEKGNGSPICFNSSGSDHIEVKESREQIDKMLG